MRFLLLALALAAPAFGPNPPASPTAIPSATGVALDGHTVVLPRDLPGRASILILGFDRNSATTTTAWEKPIRAHLATPAPNGALPAIGYLDMPFLEDAPAFLRPLILRSIRKQVPEVLKPNFVPLTADESTWKQRARFTPTASDAAYILLVDHTGQIVWQTHEPFSDTLFQQLSEAAQTLAASPH